MATAPRKSKAPFKMGMADNLPVVTDQVNPLHNRMPVQLDAKAAKAVADEAFREYDAGNKLVGTATQRLCYAIMAYHRWLLHNGSKLAELTSVIDFPGKPKSKAAMVEIFEAMSMEFLGPVNNYKDTTLTTEQIAAERTKRTNHTTLLRTALNLSAVLSSHFVTADSYDVKRASFVIPVAAIRPADHFPTGWLNSGGDNDGAVKTLAMSNRTVTMEAKRESDGKLMPKRLQVSVAQIMAAHRSYFPKAAPQSDQRKDKASVVMLVTELHAILCADDADTSEPIPVEAYPSAVWNKLTAIAEWLDMVKAGWTKSGNTEGKVIDAEAA